MYYRAGTFRSPRHRWDRTVRLRAVCLALWSAWCAVEVHSPALEGDQHPGGFLPAVVVQRCGGRALGEGAQSGNLLGVSPAEFSRSAQTRAVVLRMVAPHRPNFRTRACPSVASAVGSPIRMLPSANSIPLDPQVFPARCSSTTRA